MEQVEEIEAPTATALNPLGLYDYIVTGDRAAKAAAELEQRLDSLSHSPLPVRPGDTGDAARAVARAYGVMITATIGGAIYE